MAKGVQQYKIDQVAALKAMLEEYPNVYFSDFRGLSVRQITELRGQLRESDARYAVVKNRYTKIALRELGREGTDDYLTGPTALALVRDDVAAVSKVLLDFGRNAPVKVTGGYVDGKAIGPQDVVALSRLPGRDQLLAMLLSAMHGPVRSLVYVLHASVERVARVLKAVADQKAEQTKTNHNETG
jgi:large subunit ribosomal protein L10